MRKKINKIESDYKDSLSFKVNALPWNLALEQYIELESRSWKNGKIGIGKDKSSRSFYKSFCQSLAETNQLHFGFLYVDHQLISAEIAYSLGDKIYFSHGCYDQNFQKYSPGMVSTSYFIKNFMNKKYVTGDFLCGYSGYMNSWSESTLQTSKIDIYNQSFNNMVLISYRILKKISLAVRSIIVRNHD